MFGRQKISMIVAEFIGTFSLASVVLAMIGRTSFPYFEAVAAGATLGLLMLVFSGTATGYYNPAVTLALWTMRKLDTARTLVFVAAQFLGGVVAWTLNQYLLQSPLNNIANTGTDWRIFTAEAVGAFVFAIGLSAAIQKGYKELTLAATAGASLSVGILLASFAGNGLINPAVALGVQSWSAIYVACPILGAILGMNLYAALFAPKPTRVNAVSTKKITSKKGR